MNAVELQREIVSGRVRLRGTHGREIIWDVFVVFVGLLRRDFPILVGLLLLSLLVYLV